MCERARALLADALGLPPDQVPDDAAIGQCPSWDSLGHMRLILALEEALGRDLPPETLLSVTSLPSVARVLADAPD